jgi:phosphoserine aminotransferase
LREAPLRRSHRSKLEKPLLAKSISKTKELLEIPNRKTVSTGERSFISDIFIVVYRKSWNTSGYK